MPYFTPAQEPPAGTFIPQTPADKPPKLFSPLKLRGLTLPNRIMLAPLDQYSAENGHQTHWHIAHIGGIASRGPGATMIEALAVAPEGRVTTEDSGIWLDSHIGPLGETIRFAHSQGQIVGVQIAYSGRKGSTVAPWLKRHAWAGKDVGGFPDQLIAPSAIGYDADGGGAIPREATLEDLDNVVTKFREGAKRAIAAGADYIELHAAHGYLLHQFLSPITNKRTDAYGGSFENRVRLTLRVVSALRETMPHNMPLFVRISATDWLEESGLGESWTVEQSAQLAVLLQDAGVDLLDVSSGGLHPEARSVLANGGGAYQAPFAQHIKQHLGPNSKMLVSTVGNITTAKLAESLLQGEDGKPPLDAVMVGRGFQRNPGLVFAWADELGVQVKAPYQIGWAMTREVRDEILAKTAQA